MSIQRKIAVNDGRAMVKVRYIKTKKPSTIGVCPGCWNIKKRREVLLLKLTKMGLEVVHGNDTLAGTYLSEKNHAPGCPYNTTENKKFRKKSK